MLNLKFLLQSYNFISIQSIKNNVVDKTELIIRFLFTTFENIMFLGVNPLSLHTPKMPKFYKQKLSHPLYFLE